MNKFLPLIFVLLWSSAFVTTKPIVDNSEPFSALAFRFLIVAIGFLIFSFYSKKEIIISKKNIAESLLTGVLFHGLYLGGVFFSISKSKIFVKCFEISTTIPSPTHCPERDVPAALGISPNLLVLAKPTIFCISVIVFGNAIAKGSLL